MDLVDYSQLAFEQIKAEFNLFSQGLKQANYHFIPITALLGDNIVLPSKVIHWYQGPSLLQLLETVQVQDSNHQNAPRFAVQHIIRPQTDEFHDYRGIAGKVLAGHFNVGDLVSIWPSGLSSEITQLETFDGPLNSVMAPMSATIHLKDQIDISRGDSISLSASPPLLSNEITAKLCWMDTQPFVIGRKYLLRQNSRSVRALIKQINYKIDIQTLTNLPNNEAGLQLNDIAQVQIKLAGDLAFDAYQSNPSTGSFILVDEQTNLTVAAGVIEIN